MLGQAINGAGLVGNLHQNRITSINLNLNVAARKCRKKKQMDEKMTNSEEDFPVIVSSLPAVGIPTSYPTCFLEAIATLETYRTVSDESVKMKEFVILKMFLQ